MKFLFWLVGIFETLFVVYIIIQYLAILIKQRKSALKKQESLLEKLPSNLL
jgi:hypothetical protein